MRLEDLMERAAQYDENLARDIKDYAVLFDPRYTTRFVDAVSENKEIKTVFIVTDAAERYRSLCAELPGCRVMQLYESYLRSFEINAIG